MCNPVQVPLGVILKNENTNSDMIEIMDAVHQYVPCHVDPSVMVDGVPKKDVIEQCLFGGDLLTCERVRGAKRHRQDAATMVERLEGIEVVSEDWHAKMCLFEVRCSVNFFPDKLGLGTYSYVTAALS